MDAIAIQQEMQEYFAELNEAEQKSVLQLVKTFLASREGYSGSVSIDEYNKEIDDTLAEVAAGSYITQEELEKQSAQWHTK